MLSIFLGGGGRRKMKNLSIHPSKSAPPALVFFWVDADRCRAQFLQQMAPLCDGSEVDSVVDFFWVEVEGGKGKKSIHLSIKMNSPGSGIFLCGRRSLSSPVFTADGAALRW